MINNQVTDRLAGHIANMPAKFAALPQEKRLLQLAPGKWSPQEIPGHLIDSALNNLRRFTEIQFLPQPFTVIGYQQDNLVAVMARVGQMAFTNYLSQTIICSAIWLKYFLFGPFERVWRSLTNWKRQPMKRLKVETRAAPVLA